MCSYNRTAVLAGNEHGGRRNLGQSNYTAPEDESNSFPLCRLRGCAIVDEFPHGCPLARPNPLWAVHQLEERGWQRELKRPFPDLTGGRADRRRASICDACLNSLRSNPTILRLRALKGVA